MIKSLEDIHIKREKQDNMIHTHHKRKLMNKSKITQILE